MEKLGLINANLSTEGDRWIEKVLCIYISILDAINGYIVFVFIHCRKESILYSPVSYDYDNVKINFEKNLMNQIESLARRSCRGVNKKYEKYRFPEFLLINELIELRQFYILWLSGTFFLYKQ